MKRISTILMMLILETGIIPAWGQSGGTTVNHDGSLLKYECNNTVLEAAYGSVYNSLINLGKIPKGSTKTVIVKFTVIGDIEAWFNPPKIYPYYVGKDNKYLGPINYLAVSRPSGKFQVGQSGEITITFKSDTIGEFNQLIGVEGNMQLKSAYIKIFGEVYDPPKIKPHYMQK